MSAHASNLQRMRSVLDAVRAERLRARQAVTHAMELREKSLALRERALSVYPARFLTPTAVADRILRKSSRGVARLNQRAPEIALWLGAEFWVHVQAEPLIYLETAGREPVFVLHFRTYKSALIADVSVEAVDSYGLCDQVRASVDQEIYRKVLDWLSASQARH